MKTPLRSLAILSIVLASNIASPSAVAARPSFQASALAILSIDLEDAMSIPIPSRILDLVSCDPNAGPRKGSSNLTASDVRNRRRRRRRRRSEDLPA